MALEAEINRWSGFAKALRRPEREAFEDLMDMCRSNSMAVETPLTGSYLNPW